MRDGQSLSDAFEVILDRAIVCGQRRKRLARVDHASAAEADHQSGSGRAHLCGEFVDVAGHGLLADALNRYDVLGEGREETAHRLLEPAAFGVPAAGNQDGGRVLHERRQKARELIEHSASEEDRGRRLEARCAHMDQSVAEYLLDVGRHVH